MRYKYTLSITVSSDDAKRLTHIREQMIEEANNPPAMVGVAVSVNATEISDEDGPQHEHLKGNEDD